MPTREEMDLIEDMVQDATVAFNETTCDGTLAELRVRVLSGVVIKFADIIERTTVEHDETKKRLLKVERAAEKLLDACEHVRCADLGAEPWEELCAAELSLRVLLGIREAE